MAEALSTNQSNVSNSVAQGNIDATSTETDGDAHEEGNYFLYEKPLNDINFSF